MRLLVSLCNKRASLEREDKVLYPTVFLLEVDTQNNTITPIKIRWWTWKPKGVTGLSRYKDGFICLLQAKKHKLFYIDKSYKVKKRWTLNMVKDGHSVTVKDGRIYIASTGNDSIVEFIPEKKEERLYWKASSDNKDTIHLNSLLWVKDQLIVSAFGKRQGEEWITARNGFIMDITKGQIIKNSLFHPHTLVKTEEGIFLCESAKKRVISFEGEDELSLDKGYIRGLAISKEEIAVGISHARKRSKSTGRLNRVDDKLMQSFRSGCGIKVFKRKGACLKDAEFSKFIDLYPYGNEIYDIILF